MINILITLLLCSFVVFFRGANATVEESDQKNVSSIQISITDQMLYLYTGEKPEKKYRITTSRKPPSNKSLSRGTPLGKHEIAEIIGVNQPGNVMYKDREPIEDTDEKSPIMARIIWLRGIEPGYNAGYDESGHWVDTYWRRIYIHGVPDQLLVDNENKSGGCIRMSISDVIDLAYRVKPGTKVLIK